MNPQHFEKMKTVMTSDIAKVDLSPHRKWSIWMLRALAGACAVVVVMLINREQIAVQNSRLQETLLSSTLARSGAAVIALNKHGNIIYASEGVTALTGYSAGELVNMQPENLMPVAFRQAHKVGYQAVVAGKQPAQHQVYCQIRTKAGANITVLNHVFGYEDGGVAIISQADPQMIQYKLHEMALDSARVGIWWWDVARDRLVWDARMFNIFGVDEQTWSPSYQGFQERLHPEDKGWVNKVVTDCLHHKSEYQAVFRVIQKNSGQTVYVRAYGKVFENQEGTVFAGVNIRVTSDEYSGKPEEKP